MVISSMKVKEALHHLSMPKEKKSSKRKVGDQHGHGHQSRTVQSEMSNEKRLIKEFRCTICEIYFSSKNTLKKHNQELHLPIIPSKRPTKLTSNPASISRSSIKFQSSKPPPPHYEIAKELEINKAPMLSVVVLK